MRDDWLRNDLLLDELLRDDWLRNNLLLDD
jgi:hypothetical protein